MIWRRPSSCFFFFNDTATTEIYTLSLHDALPIYGAFKADSADAACSRRPCPWTWRDRKSTRLNSSHQIISYAVFCLKKKNKQSFLERHGVLTAHRTVMMAGQ